MSGGSRASTSMQASASPRATRPWAASASKDGSTIARPARWSTSPRVCARGARRADPALPTRLCERDRPVNAEAVGPLDLKGFHDPVQAHNVVGLREQALPVLPDGGDRSVLVSPYRGGFARLSSLDLLITRHVTSSDDDHSRSSPLKVTKRASETPSVVTWVLGRLEIEPSDRSKGETACYMLHQRSPLSR